MRDYNYLNILRLDFDSTTVLRVDLIRFTNDLFVNADTGDSSILLLLCLSAEFDTTDHDIVIDRLQQCVGSVLKSRVFWGIFGRKHS